MVIEMKSWGRWKIQGNSLVIYTPSGYSYRIPVADLKDERITKIWFSQLTVKRFITCEDLFDFRAAAREISGKVSE